MWVHVRCGYGKNLQWTYLKTSSFTPWDIQRPKSIVLFLFFFLLECIELSKINCTCIWFKFVFIFDSNVEMIAMIMDVKYSERKNKRKWTCGVLSLLKQTSKLHRLWTLYPSGFGRMKPLMSLFVPHAQRAIYSVVECLRKSHSGSWSWKNRWPGKGWFNLSALKFRNLQSLRHQFPLQFQQPRVSTERESSGYPKESCDGIKMWRHA